MTEKIFGVAIEEYPGPCRQCALLARFAMEHSDLDVTKIRPFPFRSGEAVRIARMVFPRLADCTQDICGLSGEQREVLPG